MSCHVMSMSKSKSMSEHTPRPPLEKPCKLFELLRQKQAFCFGSFGFV